MSGEIVEEAVVVGSMPIFKAFELNLARLLLFGVVDLLANVGRAAEVQLIENVELQGPDDVGGVLNVAGFFER